MSDQQDGSVRKWRDGSIAFKRRSGKWCGNPSCTSEECWDYADAAYLNDLEAKVAAAERALDCGLGDYAIDAGEPCKFGPYPNNCQCCRTIAASRRAERAEQAAVTLLTDAEALAEALRLVGTRPEYSDLVALEVHDAAIATAHAAGLRET